MIDAPFASLVAGVLAVGMLGLQPTIGSTLSGVQAKNLNYLVLVPRTIPINGAANGNATVIERQGSIYYPSRRRHCPG